LVGTLASPSAERTEVLTDQKQVMDKVLLIFSNASGIDILAETIVPAETNPSAESGKAAESYFDVKKRGGRLRILTNLDAKSIPYCRALLERGVEVRHLDEVKGNFLLSQSEYMSAPASSNFQPGMMTTVIYSNARRLVEQNRGVFEAFWRRALPATERISEIEEGTVPQKIEVIRDPGRVQRVYLDMIVQAKEEIMLILPTAGTFHRDETIGVIGALRAASLERGVRVSVMTPNSAIQEAIQTMSKEIQEKTGRRLISHRLILEAGVPETVTILVLDRRASLVIEHRDNAKTDFDGAVDLATYSTRDPSVLANIRFFERLWEEVEIREKESRSRKTAELLQDILTHDIRNYNQISITSAEVLKRSLDSNAKVLSEVATLIDGIIKATEGSANLIDRAKKLGRIISQTEIELYPVDLEDSLRTSVALIIKSHPQRSINLSSTVMSGARVVADNLLEEAFTNILSNSVNYTETDEIPVEVQVEEADEAILEGEKKPYWKITFTDHGKGIPDKLKDKIFTRYLNTATGAGLGLSIVYALVVERYSGKVVIADRVKGDYTKGTKVEVWLPKAS
jgi:two-component system, OmpR family, sensor histidine kinase VicK